MMTTDRHMARDEIRTTADVRPIGWFLPLVNGVAWVTFVGIALGVQPTADPGAVVDPVSLLISTALWSTMFAALFGLGTRARWGYLATAVGGVVLMAAAASCYAGGHTGTWLVAQAMAGVGLAATGAISWRVER